MKKVDLSENTIEYIEKVLKVASNNEIENVIIETGRVRGTHEDKTIAIIQDQDVPEFEFPSAGLSRANLLNSRLSIVRKLPNHKITVEIDEDREFVTTFTMTAKGINRTRVTYRCGNPAHISAARVIADNMVTEFEYNADLYNDLNSAIIAMGKDKDLAITFLSDDNGVKFIVEDINGDVFEHGFAYPIEDHFSYRYPAKIILSCLKQTQEGTFNVGRKGVLTAMVEGLTLYIMPRK